MFGKCLRDRMSWEEGEVDCFSWVAEPPAPVRSAPSHVTLDRVQSWSVTFTPSDGCHPLPRVFSCHFMPLCACEMGWVCMK